MIRSTCRCKIRYDHPSSCCVLSVGHLSLVIIHVCAVLFLSDLHFLRPCLGVVCSPGLPLPITLPQSLQYFPLHSTLFDEVHKYVSLCFSILFRTFIPDRFSSFIFGICSVKLIFCILCMLATVKYSHVYPRTLVTKGFGWINEACRLMKQPIIVHARTISDKYKIFIA